MGKLTDLLMDRGMIREEGEPPRPPKPKRSPENMIRLTDKFPEENLSEEVKATYKSQTTKRLGAKRIFANLPNIGEFYIPSEMNGRVIECSEDSFQSHGDQRVVAAKAYAFDGYELRYFFFDPTDNSLQSGVFTEFPRDGYGNKMGRLGLHEDVLCWISKTSERV